MRVDLNINADEFEAALKAMSKETRKEVAKVVKTTATDMKNDITISMQQGPHTGAIYTTRFFTDPQGRVRPYGTRPAHQASAPNETPAPDTGALMGSIYSEKETELTHTVGSRMAYAPYLEYGTSRMEARPYMRPSIERMSPVFRERMEAALVKVTK